MNMDWMPILVSAIGSIRLILIFTGILMLLRCIFKLHKFSEHQKQCFAVSGIVYLLGLTPQSLLLLVTNSEKATYSLDSGCLCWIQKFACIFSVSIHGILCLDCIFIILSSTHTLNKLNALADHKKYFPIFVVYVMLLATSRIFFLKGDDSNGFYMDVASKLDNASFSGWTMLPVQNSAQKVQLQLLLCESSLSARDMKYFLAVCYLLLFLPLIVMIVILKVLLPKMQKSPVANQIFLLDSAQGWQHHISWRREFGFQKTLSTLVTFWFFVVQPVVFSFQRQHFVDFGTHLLLTISVFVPWTLNSYEQKSIHSWV